MGPKQPRGGGGRGDEEKEGGGGERREGENQHGERFITKRKGSREKAGRYLCPCCMGLVRAVYDVS